MQVEKVHGSGAWNIYGVVNGYLLSRTYYGYTLAQAKAQFRIAIEGEVA